jgi:nitrogen regulatory protein PII
VLIGGPLALLGALAGPGSGRGIGEALSLRPLERQLLDQEALALVAPARPAEPDDDRAQGRVRAGAPGQGRIAAGEEDEVIEIRAGEAQGPVAFHLQKLPPGQLAPALRAGRVANDREDDDAAIADRVAVC